MIKAIERSPKIFSVSSKMIQLYDHSKMDDAGDMYTLMGWAFQRGVGRSSGGYNHVFRVFSFKRSRRAKLDFLRVRFGL